MSDTEKKNVAKSVIKIAKRDEIDKFVKYEDPLTCEVTGTKRAEFKLDVNMYNVYMNIINKAFEDGQPSDKELDSKLQEDFDTKYDK